LKNEYWKSWQAGRFNVDFDGSGYEKDGTEYYNCTLTEFDKNEKPIRTKHLHFLKNDETTIPPLKTEEECEKYMRYPEHVRLEYKELSATASFLRLIIKEGHEEDRSDEDFLADAR
jgi:hypothetical protein